MLLKQSFPLTAFLDRLEEESCQPQTLNGQVERREALEAATSALAVQDFLARHNLSDTVHCSKTGQFLRQFSVEEVGKLLAVAEEKRAAEMILKAARKQIAPHWLFTDEQALVKLAIVDPVGYFVYVASFLFPILGVDHNDAKAMDAATEARAQAKRKVWLAASKLPSNAIAAANEYIRSFLSLTTALKASKFICYQAVEFERIADSEASLANLLAACRATLDKLLRYEIVQGRLQAEFTFDEIIALQRRYGGYSNLRRQRRTRNMTDLERYEMHLSSLFDNISPETEREMYWNTRTIRAKQERAKDRQARAAEQAKPLGKRKISTTIRIIPRNA